MRPHVLPQPRLFKLDTLGQAGWLKALRLPDYAPRSLRRPLDLRDPLFSYLEAWG